MKLRNLNGAIRKLSGPVRVELPSIAGTVNVGIMKTDLIAQLTQKFVSGTTETGLTLLGDLLAIDRSVEGLPNVYLDGSPHAIGADGVARQGATQQVGDDDVADDDEDLLGDEGDLLGDDDAEDEDLL